MKVKKRDGRIQEFNIQKIKLSIERVSDEINKPLTSSDIELVAKAIEGRIRSKGSDIINAVEIHKIVVEELRNIGFTHIAAAYDDNNK